jgi:hypothetical protein
MNFVNIRMYGATIKKEIYIYFTDPQQQIHSDCQDQFFKWDTAHSKEETEEYNTCSKNTIRASLLNSKKNNPNSKAYPWTTRYYCVSRLTTLTYYNKI